jgi:fluoride exporter
VTALLVVLGAAVGAPARYLTDLAVQSVHDSLMPWGTFTVNVAGSFVVGVLGGLAASRGVSPEVLALVGTGFCGALTTFSTFGYETVVLARRGAGFWAAANVVGGVAAGLAAVYAGYLLAS